MKTFTDEEEAAIILILKRCGHEIRREVAAQHPSKLNWNRTIGISIRRTMTWLNSLEEPHDCDRTEPDQAEPADQH